MNGDGIGTSAAARSWLKRQRPVGLVQQARWLFRLGPLSALAVTLPGVFQGAAGHKLGLILLAAVALVGVWSLRYRLRRAPLLLDGAEVVVMVVMVVLAVLAPDPLMITTIAFAGFWFRALYGGLTRTILFCTMMSLGILAVRWVPAVLVHGPLPVAYLPIFVSMFTTTLIARYLANALFVREDGQHRLAALAQLGHDLIGATDPTGIWRSARVCVDEVVQTAPGVVVLVARVDGDALEVIDTHGTPATVPATLPRTVLPVDLSVAGPVGDPAVLAGVAGPGSVWAAVPPGDMSEPWLVVGGPPRVVGEIVPLIESMTAQLTLAMRTSEAHRDLTLAATCDPLTGLANRGAFTTALAAALDDPARRVALMFLDLDDFKLVNDGLGHAAGDELLRRVGVRMREGVRAGDLCARLGGDEFAVLLLDADDTALAVAQRLVDRVASPVSLAGRTAQVGASIGLAFAGPDIGAQDLVQHADVAMYAAKAKGKNRVQVFDPSLLQDDGHGTFEAELAAAAEAGQLVVLYQPIMSVADGRCHAVEALVRWQHPTRGLLGPAEFVPLAERTGAIVGIGAFVLRTACADAAAWGRAHGRVRVHVNVSVAQLGDPEFEGVVLDCLDTFAMAPHELVLEITESMVLDSVDVRVALQRLSAIGVAIAIDDFGIGYSALSTLRMLPLDIIKIDKSFIAGDPADAADEVIVEAVVQMAARLGLQVIAEGVERLDQQRFVERVGADAVQGYLHLRPTTAPKLSAWLDRQGASPAPEVAGVTVLHRTAR